MKDSAKRFENLGAAIPEILLPKSGTDLEKWAVIACDQFTQDEKYWAEVKKTVGENPSALQIIFPEIFLEKEDKSERITSIHEAMKSFLQNGIFDEAKSGFIYIERSTPHQACRRGLVFAVDLEAYDWDPSKKNLIRATEGTVIERLPPRMDIRRAAPIESPHVLILMDNDDDSILKHLGETAKKNAPVYNGDLMMKSGHISGWFINDEESLQFLAEKLEDLAAKANHRYGTNDEKPFLFAVGDGNHSLATAKSIWEEYKQAHQDDPDVMNHPARFALAELENLYDPGIAFEPIHRVLFNTSIEDAIGALMDMNGFQFRKIDTWKELYKLVADEKAPRTRFGLFDGKTALLVETTAPGISTYPLQPCLDEFIKYNEGIGIDYIHGEDEIFRLANLDKEGKNVGILLPPVKKEDLFLTVAQGGPLPRKSFSMGEACEKRFYLECRKLFA
jgi:uncharacterized protein (DUF1015 family)